MVVGRKRLKESMKPSTDIIVAIICTDLRSVKRALSDDPNCVNAMHYHTGMNAAMLSATGEIPEFLDTILEYGYLLDFGHRDKNGRTLLQIALRTLDVPTIDVAQSGYERFAPHLINNWPSPAPRIP